MEVVRKSKYGDEVRDKAKTLYLSGLTPKEIAQKLDVNGTRTVYNWINKEGWNELLSKFDLEKQLEQRILLLTHRDMKKPNELDEIDRLIANLIKLQDANTRIQKERLSIKEREANQIGRAHV